jgi:hypothetical protein
LFKVDIKDLSPGDEKRVKTFRFVDNKVAGETAWERKKRLRDSGDTRNVLYSGEPWMLPKKKPTHRGGVQAKKRASNRAKRERDSMMTGPVGDTIPISPNISGAA